MAVTLTERSVTSYVYQGNVTTVTDPAGKWKAYTVDAMGNLVKVTEPNVGDTTYAYNVLDQLTTVTMTRGTVTQTRTFNYDLATGRLSSATNPETGTVSYSWRADGLLFSKTDAKNQTLNYYYDSYGRLSSTFAGMTYTYDSNTVDPYFTAENTAGRLVAAQWSGAAGQFAELYSYTPAGLIKGKRLRLTRGASTAALDATFVYDPEGRLQEAKYPGAYTYAGGWTWRTGPDFYYYADTLGRPSRLYLFYDNGQYIGQDWAKDVVFGPADELKEMKYLSFRPVSGPWGYCQEIRTYNARLQLTSLIASGSANLTYGYPAAPNNNGRISSMTDNMVSETVNYTYL